MHVEKLHRLVSKLTSYNTPVWADTKVSKLLRIFRQRFSHIDVASKWSGVPFEKVITSVKMKVLVEKDK